ncbi:MAG TPA: hypothetical protein VFX96_17655 [Pyrinomonadaceae bacterium]|nr:hypothetical protein [Pyrinomonadaceae bacterium]
MPSKKAKCVAVELALLVALPLLADQVFMEWAGREELDEFSRALTIVLRVFAILAYYFALAVFVACWLFRNFNEQSGKPRYHFLRGGL